MSDQDNKLAKEYVMNALSHYRHDLEFSEQQLAIVRGEQNPIPHMEWNLVRKIIWLRVKISELMRKDKK